MDLIIHDLRHIFAILESYKLAAIIQNEEILKRSTFSIKVKVHSPAESPCSILGEILMLLYIDFLQGWHVDERIKQNYPILWYFYLLLHLFSVIDHLAVIAFVVIPSHLKQSKERDLTVIIPSIIIVQCHVRNALIWIDTKHSEVMSDLLEQSNIRFLHLPSHVILYELRLNDIVIVFYWKNGAIDASITYLLSDTRKITFVTECFVVIKNDSYIVGFAIFNGSSLQVKTFVLTCVYECYWSIW